MNNSRTKTMCLFCGGALTWDSTVMASDCFCDYEDDIDKLLCAGISNTMLYKLAGNSIVVNVLYHVFRKLIIDTENESKQLTLF